MGVKRGRALGGRQVKPRVRLRRLHPGVQLGVDIKPTREGGHSEFNF